MVTPKKIIIKDLELADEEIARLRKENKELRKENKELKKKKRDIKQRLIKLEEFQDKLIRVKENKELKEENKRLKKKLEKLRIDNIYEEGLYD